ncbi:MAG TPA: hypothetical protein DIV46_01715 [Verrucomicrobiales bacterium]|jgi:hypothetical protein|nr:hypothetical protein [Verrucomicrobiales bacterium]|tara:strand:+ start:59 stop:751 length:693 start_codon:yes stop_codon:yes gene_type:complete
MKIITFFFLFLAFPAMALPDKPEKGVVYVEEFAPKGIKLKVEKPGWVYSTKQGGRKRGSLKVGIEVELVSFTEKAYFVRGKRDNGIGVSGWVSPASFSSKDPKFVKKLKQVHARQLLVRALIEKKEVAIGMTPEEVSKIHTRPTKTKVKRTAKGQTTIWEFIKYETVSHFNTVRDPYTGQIFRQLTHTTNEEKSKVVIEFENGFASSIEISKNNGPGNPTTVGAPVIFAW